MTAVGVIEKASDGNDDGQRRQGCGARFVTTFNESMERQQQKQRRRNKADPWIVRKFAGAHTMLVGCDDSSDVLCSLTVGLCIALMAYCYYVFVGRACVQMIRQDPGNHGSRSAGSARALCAASLKLTALLYSRASGGFQHTLAADGLLIR